MADELKPCPFCSEDEHLHHRWDEEAAGFLIMCEPCGGRTMAGDSLNEAIAAWNTRPAPKADSALVGELKKDFRCWIPQTLQQENVKAEALARLAALSDRDLVLEGLLRELAGAEAHYRLMHDTHGDGHMKAGRAWDLMRRAGDKARAALKGGVDE